MRNLLTVLITVLYITPCFSQQDKLPAFVHEISYKGDVAYFQGSRFNGILVNEKRIQIGEFRNGLKNGLFLEFHKNDRKKLEGQYVNGIKEGLHHEWFENGNKMSEFTFLNGKLNGQFTEWYRNGNKKLGGNYSNDKFDGKIIEYFEDGKTKNTMQFLRGKKHGKYSEWHKNGILKKEISYNDDKISYGTIIEYDELGQKYSEMESKLGVIISELYYHDGKLITYYDYTLGQKKSEGIQVSGVREGIWIEWYDNGQKLFEGEYSKGEKNGKGIEYFKDGSVKWDGLYKEGKIHGQGVLSDGKFSYKGYWDSGKKNGVFSILTRDESKAEGKFINDIKEGIWTEVFLNGNKKSEAHYTNGSIVNGGYNEWFSNGQKKEEKTYINNQLHGMHSIWFNNGQIKSAMNYYFGKISDGQYFVYDVLGNYVQEVNYEDGLIRSEYLYSGRSKNGSFVEYYSNGNKRVSGHYSNGRRRVDERYGANKTMNRIMKGIGSVVLVVGIIFVGAMTGTLN